MKQRTLLVCILIVFALPLLPGSEVTSITWETTAQEYKGRYTEKITFQLPPNGTPKPVYGFGEYAWNSSIGSAAVAMDLLTYKDGGTVTILIVEGPEYYKSGDTYEGWNTTFVFLDAKGNIIKPDEASIMYIDIPEEPFEPVSTPSPKSFTVSNNTGTTLTYLGIFSSDMRAVGVHKKNLLANERLPNGQSVQIYFAENPDLEAVILYRYGQVLQVDATAERQREFRYEWRPDTNNLQIILLPEHERKQKSLTSLAVINEGEYALVELYLLTPAMEAKRDYSKEILQGQVIRSGETCVIDLMKWPYLRSFLEKQTQDLLSVEAYDEDGYPLFQFWLPEYENLEITLSDWDYL